MGGIVRYCLTLSLEMVGVGLRYWIITQISLPFFNDFIVHTLAIVGAAGPPCYSFLGLIGPPGGNWIVRWKLGGRLPTVAEQNILTAAFRNLAHRNIAPPRFVYTIDQPDLNAGVIGHTLYLHRDLYASPHLIAVLAHEMGHYHSNDGRLVLALHRLTIPGGWQLVSLAMGMIGVIGNLLNTALRLLSAISYIVLRIEIAIPAQIVRLGRSIVYAVLVAVAGGIGIVIMLPLWRDYFRQRELVADRYAAHHGLACALTLYLRQSQLDEINLPWNETAFHPPLEERLAALQPYLPYSSDDAIEQAIA
ncbi:M48 family metalloprotease [Chloroflexus sp.]|uniref:M48 family metalloprotease n=2 Tax=Chloroflexus sp. TaxID=1904827 RepID=UPI002ACD6176|nr:M48 family metalloprotease [Chloroflexus sp.]